VVLCLTCHFDLLLRPGNPYLSVAKGDGKCPPLRLLEQGAHKMKSKDLSDYVDQLQIAGRYTFPKTEAYAETGLAEGTLKKALWRLEIKNRIRMIRRGFYVIVPLEYSSTKIIPADWFIADLMKFMRQPYYVGLLSAAAMQGAAHQQPQEFHVVVPSPQRDIRVDGLMIRFFKKSGMKGSPVDQVKTSTGYIRISSPAVTAIDLVAYSGRVGGLDRVLSVLQELSSKITPDMLVEAARKEKQMSYIQRLGWLLEKAGEGEIVGKLEHWASRRKPSRTPLDPALPTKGFQRDSRWNVVVNSDLKVEL